MRNFKRLLLLILIVPFPFHFAIASTLEVYGRVSGINTPQPLTLEQVESMQFSTLNQLPTLLLIVSDLNTSKPKLHVVDTQYFKDIPAKYGLHEAYAVTMGLASNSANFLERMKTTKDKPRALMPFTLYLVSRLGSEANNKPLWVLQNRRYNFEDSSESFTATLITAQKRIKKSLPFLAELSTAFITYNKQNSFHRPNLQTVVGKKDIEILKKSGFLIISEDELAAAEFLN